MAGYHLTLASGGSPHNTFQRGVSKPTRNATQQHGRVRTQNLLSSKRIAAQKSSLSPPRINWEKKNKKYTTIKLRTFFSHNNNQRHVLPPTRNAAQQHGRGDHAKFAFVQANCCPKTMLANLSPNWEKKCINTQQSTLEKFVWSHYTSSMGAQWLYRKIRSLAQWQAATIRNRNSIRPSEWHRTGECFSAPSLMTTVVNIKIK